MTFTRAQTVAAGDRLTSAQMRSLALAFNDRIRSGWGDAAWRICMMWFNLFRQIRNPNESHQLFPGQAEFFEIYQHIDPDIDAQLTWPIADGGEAEGINLATPIGQFVYGVGNVDSEQFRVGEDAFPFWLGTNVPNTLAEIWELGKAQRGVITADGAFANQPAFVAAQSFFQFVTPYFSPHGKSYGGFFPTPQDIHPDANPTPGDFACGSNADNGATISSVEIKFTALRSDVSSSGFNGVQDTTTINGVVYPVIKYLGTCPDYTLYTGEGHVQGILRFPFAYYVFVRKADGSTVVDRFDTDDWLEGPYTGEGRLARHDAGQLNRALWGFIQDFKGTASQRTPDNYTIERIAFDFQEFFTRQYYLAPNVAEFSGDELTAKYPYASVANGDTGTSLHFNTGGDDYSPRDGFVIAGMVAAARYLAEPAFLDVFSNGERVATMTLQPDSTGYAEAMKWLKTAIPSGALVEVKLRNPAKFTHADGVLWWECTEQQDYKPQYFDAYLVLRCMATLGGDATGAGIDGGGTNYSEAKQLWENYRRYGCIYNVYANGVRTQAEWINSNPVFDAARRMSREWMRVVARRQFRSYAIENGKSVLRFNRYAYGRKDSRVDCFAGIAPSWQPLTSGELVEGEKYIVRNSGSIDYMGGTYTAGQTFVAKSVKSFQAHGDAALLVYDGIRAAARKNGWSNEWVMFLQTKCYHPSASSIWKPDAYSDYFAWNNRCHFYSGTLLDAAFKRHGTYNYWIEPSPAGSTSFAFRQDMRSQAQLPYFEAPTGYSYAFESNDIGVTTDFYNSCQIYQKPYEVESCTIEYEGGEEIVVLTFKTRFRSHPSAPSSFSSDATTWSTSELNNLAAEGYRTDDNALREYMRHSTFGDRQCSFKTGDSGTNSGVTGLPDNPFGSCYPHFFFCKLVPMPYEDENDMPEEWDTRATSDTLMQCESYLRAMCEGWIDDQTTLDVMCAAGVASPSGALFDYTFENLCFDAFQGRDIGAFRDVDRPDRAAGFGPLPNTYIRSEVFNRLAKAVNLLKRVRVMLPFQVKCRTDNYYGEMSVGAEWSKDGVGNCYASGSWAMATSSGVPSTTLSTTGSWSTCGATMIAQSTANVINLHPTIPDTAYCIGTAWAVAHNRSVINYKVEVSTDALNAVPEDWRNEIVSIGGIIAHRRTETSTANFRYVSTSAESRKCPDPAGPNFFWDGTTGVAEVTPSTTDSGWRCEIADIGVIDPGPAPAGRFISGFNKGYTPVSGCNNSSDATETLIVLSDSNSGFFVTATLGDLA